LQGIFSNGFSFILCSNLLDVDLTTAIENTVLQMTVLINYNTAVYCDSYDYCVIGKTPCSLEPCAID